MAVLRPHSNRTSISDHFPRQKTELALLEWLACQQGLIVKADKHTWGERLQSEPTGNERFNLFPRCVEGEGDGGVNGLPSRRGDKNYL